VSPELTNPFYRTEIPCLSELTDPRYSIALPRSQQLRNIVNYTAWSTILVAARSTLKGVGVRPFACWDCWLESHRDHGSLSFVSAVCC